MSEKRGRVLLLIALGLMAVFVVKGVLSDLGKPGYLPAGMVGNGLMMLALILAYRGGEFSLKVVKGLTLLFAAVFGLLLLFIAVTLFRGIPLPQVPTVANTVPGVVGILFLIWALFFSRSVRDFIGYQQASALQRELEKIKRSVAR